MLGRLLNLFLHLVHQQLQRMAVQHAFVDQPARKIQDRIALGFERPLGRGLVRALVVGERVGLRTDHARMHQRRAFPLTAILRRRAHGLVGGEEIHPIHLLQKQCRETGQKPGHIRARRLVFHRD